MTNFTGTNWTQYYKISSDHHLRFTNLHKPVPEQQMSGCHPVT